jgi:hypothetical protein
MEVVRCFEIHQTVRIITDNVPFLAEVVLKWMVCCNQFTNTHRWNETPGPSELLRSKKKGLAASKNICNSFQLRKRIQVATYSDTDSKLVAQLTFF